MTRVIFLLGLALVCCIDPLPLKSISGKPVLVVDGMITDQPGPYKVKLLWASPASANEEDPQLVTGAAVWISDDKGLNVKLSESQAGFYQTDSAAIRGKVGNVYTLRILHDGIEYLSFEEPLMPAGEVDSVYSEFVENSINQTDPTQPQDALTFFVDAHADPAYPKGLTRWRSIGIYEVLTFPELRIKMENELPVPDPLGCSGFINVDNELHYVQTCLCCYCWVYEYSREATVSPNRFVTDNQFNNIAVTSIPVDVWRFFNKYYIEVEQLSVSENVYEFWKRVGAQHAGSASLFQPNAVKVQGNIRCTTDADVEVYGIFSASAIVRKSTFVTRGQLPKLIGMIDTVTFDCRHVFENATTERPPFW